MYNLEFLFARSFFYARPDHDITSTRIDVTSPQDITTSLASVSLNKVDQGSWVQWIGPLARVGRWRYGWAAGVTVATVTKGSAEGGSGKSWCNHTGKDGRRENERVLRNLCVPIQDVGWALKLLSETP